MGKMLLFIHFLGMGTQLRVRPVDRFSRMMAQTTRTHARMYPLGFIHMAPHLGGQLPKINLGCNIGVFKPNSRNRKTRIISKLRHRLQPNFHSDKDHQIPFMGGPNTGITNPRWRTAAILKNQKSPYLSRGSSDVDEI